MPFKDPLKKKAYAAKKGAQWYQQNKELTKARSRESRKRYKQAWLEYKGSQACAHCGLSHPALIDFHHVDRKDKKSVWALVRGRRYEEAMREAMEKCIALCANCHRMLHWEEAQERRGEKKRKKALKGFNAH